MTRDNEHFGSDLGWSLAALVRENTGNPRAVTIPDPAETPEETAEESPVDTTPVGFALTPIEEGDDRFDIEELPEDDTPLPEDGEEDFDIPTMPTDFLDFNTYDEVEIQEGSEGLTKAEPDLTDEPEEDFSLMLPDFDPAKYLNLPTDTSMGLDPALTRALADEAQAAMEGRTVAAERVEYPPVNIPAEAGPRDARTVMLMLQELAALRDY